MVTELNKDTFKEFTASGSAVVDLYTEWCGPCKMMAPIVDALSDELTEIKFGKLDVDKAEEIAVSFGVQYIPTLLFFKDGVCVEKTTGLKKEEELKAVIAEKL